MRSRIHAVVIPSELGELADEVRSVFAEIGRPAESEALTGQCTPALDVYETDDSIEISVDLPGVPSTALRVITKGDNVLIAGEKAPRRARGESSFHLVERGFGRFARVVRFGRPCDAARARATLVDGELRISMPKLTERRGRAFRIPVHAGDATGPSS